MAEFIKPKHKNDEQKEGREGQIERNEDGEGQSTLGESLKSVSGCREDPKEGEITLPEPVARLTRLRTTSASAGSDQSQALSPMDDSMTRKRPRSTEGVAQLDFELSSSESDAHTGNGRRSTTSAKRGRGRRAMYMKEPTVEEEVAALVGGLKKKSPSSSTPDLTSLDTEALSMRVETGGDVILKIAAKSGNLKGTYIRALKDSVGVMKESAAVLKSRTVTEETALLRADNERLKAELTALRAEFEAMRAELADTASRAAATADREFRQSMMREIGGMFDAKLAGIEDRLLPNKNLRPPLAAAASANAVPTSGTPTPTQPKSTKGKGKGKGKSTQALASSPSAVAAATTLPTQRAPPQALSQVPGPSGEAGWTQVVRRGKSKLARAPALMARSSAHDTPSVSASRPQRKDPKLRPPRSAAVVLTLQPSAAENGTTYADILTRARERISISELGIPALKVRKAATGARVLEIPGAMSGEKADVLAQKLREALSADSVRVDRPVKCADLRISGLDDSVTLSEVVAAVARVGGCSTDAIRAGEIRRSPSGLGTLFVRCPVVVAKKIANTKLLVGWVSAQVKVLPARPMRCFRCLEVGHVRAQCTSVVDRSDECFRCGQNGHKSASCSADPHCSICTAAGQPADHRVGAQLCKGAKKFRRKAATKALANTTAATTVDASIPCTSGAAPGEAMVLA